MKTSLDIKKIITAARAGGEVVRSYFGKALLTEEKSNVGDLRTKADIDSEAAILSVLNASFPTYNIYAEESGVQEKNSEYTFVVDPLDGTNNFVLGIPDFAISIGLLKNNETILGVIYNPILDQMYFAEKDGGAFLNDKKIQVNQEADIMRATISFTKGYNTPRVYCEEITRKLHDLGIKRLVDHWAPAYDYCLLASGRIEAVINKEGDLEDYVAAKIIVVEAGGKITNFKNETVNDRVADFVASNSTGIHDKLLGILS